MSKKKVIIKRV